MFLFLTKPVMFQFKMAVDSPSVEIEEVTDNIFDIVSTFKFTSDISK